MTAGVLILEFLHLFIILSSASRVEQAREVLDVHLVIAGATYSSDALDLVPSEPVCLVVDLKFSDLWYPVGKGSRSLCTSSFSLLWRPNPFQSCRLRQTRAYYTVLQPLKYSPSKQGRPPKCSARDPIAPAGTLHHVGYVMGGSL